MFKKLRFLDVQIEQLVHLLPEDRIFAADLIQVVRPILIILPHSKL